MIEFSRPGSWRWSTCLPRQPPSLAIARVCALQLHRVHPACGRGIPVGFPRGSALATAKPHPRDPADHQPREPLDRDEPASSRHKQCWDPLSDRRRPGRRSGRPRGGTTARSGGQEVALVDLHRVRTSIESVTPSRPYAHLSGAARKRRGRPARRRPCWYRVAQPEA